MLKLKLDFIIELAEGISVTHLYVTGGKAYELDQLNDMRTPENKNIIKGSIEINIFDKKVTILLLFAGEPNLAANFNFLLNEKKLFKENKLFVMPSNGKGKFEEEIELPI
jgi:hypothetical protein